MLREDLTGKVFMNDNMEDDCVRDSVKFSLFLFSVVYFKQLHFIKILCIVDFMCTGSTNNNVFKTLSLELWRKL